MPSFQYQSRNNRGELVNGELEAANADAAAGLLNTRGMTPLKIVEGGAADKAESFDVNKLFAPKVKIDDLILFSRQMYSLSKAGVPIIRALRGLAGSTTHEQLKETLFDVADTLESGVDLASSLSRHPKVFTDLYVAVIHVGENSGRLDLAFKQVASYLELERETKKRMSAATRYPMFVIGAIVAAVTIINIFVIPKFAQFFEKFNAELPWQTKVLVGSSNFMLNYWPFMLAAIIGAIVFTRYYLQTEQGRHTWDRKKLRLPIVGSIFERISLGRFAGTFAMVTRAGLPIVQALAVVAEAVGNAYVAERINSMRNGIERGESFSRTAANTGLFSPLVMQMIVVGEETGSMDDLLDEVADFYEEEVDYDLKRLGDRIEPILLAVVAALVLILALGVFLPMWDLSSAVKGG